MKIPCVYMRGGTSKGVIFQRKDLPVNKELWDNIFLKVMGGPDPKQIDGLGGTVSSNNKILVVSPSEKADVDVEYLVAQVVVGKPIVDYSANCGNMTSAVGPFAISKGLVQAQDPVTRVRMLNLNTNTVIEEFVPARNGIVEENGDCAIAGIDGTGAELKVNFLNPAGAKTGKLFPTGNVTDEIHVEGLGYISVSIIDISNVFVFVDSTDIGIKGDELPAKLNSNKNFLDTVECIRGKAAEKIGLVDKWQDAAASTPGSPKLVIIGPPMDYTDIGGKTVKKEDMDICIRVVSVGAVHKASPLTGAIAIGGAVFIKDSIMKNYLQGKDLVGIVRIGHPSGVMNVFVDYEILNDEIHFNGIAAQRTARKIMEGYVYITD
ncbi:2-methylaconitate cis-trans isomerase PrpF family protein [Lutispora sp.]|uniref:2-methylaconitate cis-trans isomerase PrpF family protein n=1 Tax=Lutispora sp. TaxID=2828727 RepID=UPI002B1EB24C|nr:PrpF domain-containing protein [Lutispora sp.]MEA4960741.1 PrpF domain-containing protein [Lutispora sp.]